MFDQVRRTSAADIAGATVLAVASITAPSELNSRAGVTNGALCLVTQNVAGANEWTLYAFDATSSASVNSPYILAASGSGQWIAMAGKYCNGAVALASTLNVTGGTSTFGAIDATSIGATTRGSGLFTSIGASGQITSTLATGTAPFSITSTTVVPNLNVALLNGTTWTAPGPIGGGTPSTGAFTTLAASGIVTFTNATEASAVGTASVVLTGGLSVAKNILGGSQFAVAGTPNANACITINTTTPAAISGTTEYGMFVDFRSDTSATTATRGAFYRAGTSAAAYTCATVSAIVIGNTIVGAGSTVTRGIGINLSQQNTATNSYGISHSSGTPATGNYFIYDDVGYASLVSGVWTHSDTTEATAIGTASVVLSGGLSVAKVIRAASIQNTPIGSTTASTGSFTTIAASGTITVTQTVLGTQSLVLNHDATGASTVSAGTFQAGNNVTSQTNAGVLDCILGSIEAATDIFLRCRSNGGNKILFFGDGHATFSAGLTVGSTTLLTTSAALTNGAAAQAGTLLNAPAAGNPTKWVPINDNGTTRYIPAW